jgi:hypothetical protein
MNKTSFSVDDSLMNRYAYSPAQREEFEQLISDLYLNQKKSVREIAKITGYTYEHIRKLLIKLGIYSSHQVSDNFIALWRKLFSEGKNLPFISRKTGFSIVSIRNYLTECGDLKPKSVEKIPEGIKTQWIKLFSEGFSTGLISKKTEHPAKTIRAYIFKNGLCQKGLLNNKYPPEDRNRWEQLFVSGMSVIKIAKLENISTTTIYTSFHEAGIPIRKRNK